MREEYDFTDAARGPAVRQPGKTRITILIDGDVLAAFRARAKDTGRGYQTRNDASRKKNVGMTAYSSRIIQSPAALGSTCGS